MENPATKFPGLRGCVKAAMWNAKTGEEVYRVEHMNSPATEGLAWLWLHALSGLGASSQVIGFLGIGTDTTAPATGDTGLGSEVTRKAIDSFVTSGMTATDGPYFEAQCEFATNEGNTTLAEAALFNSSSGGTMIAHGTYATTAKTTDYVFGVSYQITQDVT